VLVTSDWRALRARFPVLAERSYFASQCLGPFPSETLADLDEYRATLFLRNRGLETWVMRLYEMNALVEQLLGAPPGTVALRDSATSCQAAIASAIAPLGQRRRILVAPQLDFKSSRYLWRAQEARGFEVVDVSELALDAERLRAVIDERTAVVALPLVSPRNGALLPLAEISARVREAGAILVADAYQAVGIVPIDVERLGADAVVGGSHKWLCGGGMGLAFMYLSPRLLEELPVVYPGWVGSASLLKEYPRFEPAPAALRFQQGAPAMEPIYTARAGIRFVLEVGVEALRARSLQLTDRLLDGLAAHGIATLTPRDRERRGGMVCVDVPDPETVVMRLREQAIDVDAREGAGVRIGPFPCLEESEIDRLVTELARRNAE
jgi:selenocysteine lyase/cysteine desulfurase